MSSIFESAFKGDVVTPTDHGYDDAIFRWSKTAVRRAAIVAFVKSAEDVALALRYAVDHKLAVAVRGGGHSAAGNSSVEGGLVIDLSRYLNGVRVDPERKLGYVGGGAIWETVDKTNIQYGLATVAGTVSHVSLFSAGRYIFWTSFLLHFPDRSRRVRSQLLKLHLKLIAIVWLVR